MPICGKINANILFDCLNPIIGGVEAKIRIYNREDIAGYVRNAVNPQIIEGITMVVDGAVARKGFLYEGINASVKPKMEMVRKEYGNRYDHIVDFIVFKKGSAAKAQLAKLANGSSVAVIENVSKSGDTSFEVFGTDVGLELKSLTSDANDSATEGAFVLQLGSPENVKEPHMPATLFVTSYAATKTMLDLTITV